MGWINDIFRRREPVRWSYGGGGLISLSSTPYAAAVVSSCLEVLFNAMSMVRWSHPWVDKHANEMLYRLLADGRVGVYKAGRSYRLKGGKQELLSEAWSDDYATLGKSTMDIIKPFVRITDDILNAIETSTKRLGVLVLLTPASDTYGNASRGLTEAEMRKIEQSIQRDYGMLEEQSIVKVLNHELKVDTVNISGQDLKLEDKLCLVIKLLVGKLGIPYELTPFATISTNTSGVYQEEARKTLGMTVNKWCKVIQDACEGMTDRLTYSIDAPSDIAGEYDK